MVNDDVWSSVNDLFEIPTYFAFVESDSCSGRGDCLFVYLQAEFSLVRPSQNPSVRRRCSKLVIVVEDYLVEGGFLIVLA